MTYNEIVDVETIWYSGDKPDSEEILSVLQARQEEGLRLEDIKFETMFDSQGGYREHYILMLFTDNEDRNPVQDFVDEYDSVTTQELEDELI